MEFNYTDDQERLIREACMDRIYARLDQLRGNYTDTEKQQINEEIKELHNVVSSIDLKNACFETLVYLKAG